jgi:hypothetical protein
VGDRSPFLLLKAKEWVLSIQPLSRLTMIIFPSRHHSTLFNYLIDARAVGRKLGQGIAGELNSLMDELFDNHLYPFANYVDYMATALIQKGESTAKQLIKDSIEQVANLVEEFFKQAQARIDALKNLVTSTVKEIERLETEFFRDANALIDSIEEVLAGQITRLELDIKKFKHLLPTPWDDCKRQLNIHWKSGLDLSYLEVYRLMECYELSNINENSSIKKIFETYAQLQHRAILMKYLARGAPAFQSIFIQDWFKYGRLCDIWNQYR